MRKYLILAIILIGNIGFILTFVCRHEVPIELIDTLEVDTVAYPHFEFETKDVGGVRQPCLLAYGRCVEKVEYNPLYIFTKARYFLTDEYHSYEKSVDYIFSRLHPYVVEYEAVEGKIYEYKLPDEFLYANGIISEITHNKYSD